jgi:small subunit ribosomal protein S20
MPRSRTVIKRQRQTEVRRQRNKAVRSELKTRERKVRQAGDPATAATELKAAQKALDKAAAKGVIHANKAARKKSRLAKAAAKAS